MRRELVFFDVETSGLDVTKHTIIQIAAIAVEADSLQELEVFEKKIRFRMDRADEKALEMNSYDREAWASDALGPATVEPMLSDFLKRHSTVRMVSKKSGKEYHVAQMVAQNSDFDMKFLTAWYKRLDAFCPAGFRAMCTMQRALWYFTERGLTFPENFKNETLAKHFGMNTDNAHDALGDVRMTLEVYKRIRDLSNPNGPSLAQLERMPGQQRKSLLSGEWTEEGS